jgi:hypothetical protein
MSEVKVNKISPRSGTNVQLGDSGDTITVPSGATLDASNATTTLPANVVTTTGSQTLTNKIIGSSQLTGALPALDGSALTGIPDTIAPTRHSIRPSLNLDFANSKALDPRITFTRASNATYYDGYTSVKAEENLYSYSQEFDNGYWSRQAITVTADDIVAPDGTTTAEKITATSTLGAYINRGSIMQNGKEYTLSIYAKAGTADNIRISNITSGTTGGWFDLSTGTIGTQNGASNSSTITDVGNGWYRITRTFGSVTANSSTESLFGINDGDGLTTAPLNGYLYVWGAQLEQRDTVTAYTPTTTQPITNYVPALQTAGNNVARFDHNPTTGESLGLLIEESRTNVAINSEDFSNATWGKTRCTIDANKAIAPDGTQTADLIVGNGVSGSKVIVDAAIATPTANSLWTATVYAKTIGSVSGFRVELGNGPNNGIAYFNLSTGTVTSVTNNGTVSNATASITDVGNDWYRCSLTVTHSASWSGTTNIAFYDNDTSVTTFGSILIWGAQVEAGSLPTSYIKTTSSQVTRSGDDAKMQNINTSDWYKFSGYSFYAEGNFNGGFNINVGARGILGATQNGDTQNRFILGYNGTDVVVSQLRYAGTSTTVSTAINGSTIDDNFIKVAISLDFNNFISSANGATGSSITNLPSLPNLTDLRFGRWTATNQINGCIKKVSYYPINLTQNEINDLTEE